MENFVVSARKYRPQTFESVVGQKHITNTLKNAILHNQLAQAFLFCGPRGVGKTTCARIFAKVINCMNLGDNLEPCNACESCTSFNNNASFNIHELDAASNNSVEDIRNLVEQVRIPPQVGDYKVYIIDEVHMLSQAAFNAFLKTLEEPPPYAKFILATTEKHKIIPTILSRCQIFDFKRITLKDIAQHLNWVAGKENITAEPEALHVIAQKADGAMRDALSIFDQLVSFAGTTLTYQNVIENLNVLDHEYYFRLTDHLVSHDIKQSILLLHEIISNGFDGQHFLIGYGEHLRNMLISRDVSTLPLMEESESIIARYKEMNNRCSEHFIIEALKKQSSADTAYKISNNKRLLLELMLIETALIDTDSSEQKKKNSTVAKTPSAQPETKTPVQAQAQTQINRPSQQPVSQPTPPVPAPEPAPSAPAQDKSVEPKKVSTLIPEVVIKSPQNPIETTPKQDKPVGSRPVRNGRIRSSSTISINHEAQSVLKQDQQDREKREAIKIQAQPVDPEEMVSKIMEWVEPFKEENQLLYSALTTYTPQLKDETTILLKLDNKVQGNAITKYQAELMEHLRMSLKNNNLQLEFIIPEEKRETKIFTVDDKFKEMVKKNPDIGEMKSRLGLEFEY